MMVESFANKSLFLLFLPRTVHGMLSDQRGGLRQEEEDDAGEGAKSSSTWHPPMGFSPERIG